jgi:hypothetical protein
MKKLLGLLCLTLAADLTFAQDLDSKYAGLIKASDLKNYLTVLASDEMEGRETGTEGQRRAAVFIETQFKSVGLKSVSSLKGFQQYYPLWQDSLREASFSVNGKDAEYGKDFIVSLSQNEAGKFKSKKIAFVGYGIDDPKYSDYQNIDVKGKVVIFFLGEPKGRDGNYVISGGKRGSEWTFPGLSKKLAAAAAKGATGAIYISPNSSTFSQRTVESGKKTGVYFPELSENVKKVKGIQVSHEFARTIMPNDIDTLLKRAKAGQVFGEPVFAGKWKLEFKLKKDRTVINASNVIGYIEGTDKKDEYVFLTGHYDHLGKHDGKIYYGADDDGSGTCAVIEMANAFMQAVKEGHRPRRTMVFMTVSGEEKGLWGSEYYSDHPIFDLDKTSVDLNTDMVGRIDTERKTADSLNYVYVIGHDKISSDLPVINEAANKKHAGLVLDYKFDDPSDPNRIYFRSDHYNFARKGVPILFFYDGMLQSDYHKPTDTVDKIYWDLYEKRVRMIFGTAWEMANRNDMLKRDTPLNMK